MRIWTTAIGLVVVAAAGYGVVSFVFPEALHDVVAADAAQQEQPPAGGPPPAFPVPVSVISKTTVPVYLEYVGTTEAIREVTLQAKVGGYLQETGITDGADVKEGDLLYRIDPDDYQAALDQAKARLQGDQAALEYATSSQKRNAALSATGAVAKDTNDEKTSLMHQAQANIMADKAAIRTAQLNLGYTELRAPFDGRLGKSLVHEGALVTAQTTEINTLVQMSPIYATFNPSETDLALIQKYRAGGDLTVDISIAGEDKPRVSGKLTFLDNTVDRNTGTITARATVENTHHELLPGQYIKVRLHLTEKPDALLVPQIALGSSQMGRFVYVIGEKGTVEQRFIETGALMGDKVVINKGLQAGDKVITGNLQKIGPGMPVQALPEQPSAS
ncbi:efflux RND transporter periplasmic adaptor subunit [Dongia sedimenti]|uniref:Efflux RND transporter periplasmic adaptor subunit n=1 Tax=Dongia sedimenti TaxID=3064282 RepID=A0ABU0YH60_9PROT|nr:efflux RND transporter periplasmic adaptor subunit [Rhodospirillaceae bacterium R-7]